ncbi:aspartate-alanine antiporter [Zophobihabitans entericus]|uniref:Aspartate-alanine antiporter n=1 Tax=Zophobihabitans entericus TaxID=1635327 RepID=A0A6G9IAX4_9GAMM|nr:aspartate-alanine antiporter [Zophobihabitans entericus]QIQ20982.1 aspartate-alanine antiporter [Zophobihabitans entericus]
MEWLKSTLQTYPEIAVFLALAFGYWFGGKSYKGFSLGAVTSTLICAIIIGQWDITISDNVKSIFFLLFLFAVGYGIGPQFVKSVAKNGIPQALFAIVQCIFSLAIVVIIAKLVGYNLGASTGLFAGSQTMSASIGLASDAISRLNLSADELEKINSSIPVAYAVSYIFGTVGSALLLTYLGPILLRVDIAKACQDYEKEFGSTSNTESQETAWHDYELRAYKITQDHYAVGLTIKQLEAKFPDHMMFIEGLERQGKPVTATSSQVLQSNDILIIGGDHQKIVSIFDNQEDAIEIANPELLKQPIEGIDVFITNKKFDGKTLEDISKSIEARGVFIRRIRRGAVATEIPVLAKTQLHRGDIVTLTGLTKDVEKLAKDLGYVDRQTSVTDVAFLAGAIAIGALIGAVVIKIGGVPITLSTAGGALIAGLIFGWLRSIRPKLGRIPEPTVWFMNSVGLNVFIAVVGLSAGPKFIIGLEQLGISLFLWGIVATSVPLILGVLVGRYIFRFHPALVLGCCAGARTTTAALGMICERAKSNVPGLGYTITYAIGNTLLTIWGMVLIMLLS